VYSKQFIINIAEREVSICFIYSMGKVVDSNCFACKTRSDIFSALSDNEIAGVDCDRVSVNFKPGEIIFKQGAPCNNFVCITSGLVKLYLEHENSNNVIIGLVRPVNYIFEPGAFSDNRHHFTAVSCEETTACLIDIKMMQNLMMKNPLFATEYIRKISQQAIELYERISGCNQKQVFGRMADALLYLNNRIYEENPFKLSISRQDIADLAGMTKESAIRVLKKFKDDNLILLDGNTLEILNKPMLEAISKNG
jgi:CRP/FNR family transcriptional regulator, polysaccharide utilization system transcription regulator